MIRAACLLVAAAALAGCQGARGGTNDARGERASSSPALGPAADASRPATGALPDSAGFESPGSHRTAAAPVDPRRRNVVTEAVARVSPAVITVQTEIVQQSSVDPFDALLGGRPSERVFPGLGSGFIIRPDGVIVTNAHVVAGAKRVSVALPDGTTYPAKIIGQDEINDLAVLKIDAKGLPVAVLGTSSDLIIGEWAIAIGNPYGFLLGNSEPSVTVGVISGTGRNLAARAEGSALYVDMIQTDAAINPGNSGGPLVNALGQVVGVNSSIYTPSGGSVGLGFAIPIDRVKRVVDDILAHGAVRRPWTGVQIVLPRTQNPRDVLNSGVTVRSVVPGSPADRAGLHPGDVILRAGSRVLHNPFDWEAAQLDMRVGEPVALAIRRQGRVFTVRLTAADLPEVTAPKVEVLKELELVTLTPGIRAQYGIRSTHGALIFNVTARVADDLGIEKGDVIVQINSHPVTSAQDAARALDEFASRGVIRMFFERGGRIYSTEFMIR